MRSSASSRLLSVVRVVSVTGLLVAGVGLAGFSLQALGFPRPTRGQLVVSSTLNRLLSYQEVSADERVRGREQSSSCVQTTVPTGPKRLPAPTERVVVGNRLLVDRGIRLTGPGRPAARLLAFLLAACPAPLSNQIGLSLARREVQVRRVQLNGVEAYRLQIGRPARRLILFVERRTFRPLELRVALGRVAGVSVIESVRMRPRSLATIEAAGPNG